MAEIKWIKITTDMFNDEKIEFIESLPENDAILNIWIKLLTLAGKLNSNGYIFLTENIPYTDEMLAHKFRRPINVVRLALETFRKLSMIDNDESGIYIVNWEKHQNIAGMERVKQLTKERVKKHREKQKQIESNVTCNVTVTQSNATDIDKELDIDKEIYKEEEENGLKSVVHFYESNGYGTISPITAEDIIYWLKKFEEPEQIIIKALEIGVKNNARKWSYVEKILQDWQQAKLNTLSQVNAHQEQFRQKKQQKNPHKSPQKPSQKVPDYILNPRQPTKTDDDPEKQAKIDQLLKDLGEK